MKRNKVVDAIRSRKSVRGYQVGPVSKEQLETIVDCGRLAPTGMNMQPWEFVVITSAHTLKALADLVPDNGPFIVDAAACIVIAADPAQRCVYLDGAAATQNILLAIHGMGLASCWVQAYEKDYNPAVMELLGIPDNLVLVSILPVGIQFGEVEPRTKRPLEEVIHWERF